jgi:hypothetical protein
VFVLLLQNDANGQPVFVKALTVEEVEAKLLQRQRYDGTLGQYWWLPEPHDSAVPF